MPGNEPAQSLPLINEKDFAFLFEEAIQAKLVPYNVMVWIGFFFDRFDDDQSHDLVNLYSFLLNDCNVQAIDIATWCTLGTLYNEALRRAIEAFRPQLRSFLIANCNYLNNPPTHYSYDEICTDYELQKKWLKQTKHCLTKPEYQIAGLTSMRKSYVLMGLLVWQIKIERSWANDPALRDFNAYEALGYGFIASHGHALRIGDLRKAYNAAFSQSRGIGRMSFKEFTDGRTAADRIVEQINENSELKRSKTLLAKITSFFKNLQPQKEDSVLCLNYVLKNDIHWEKILDFCLFDDAAQDYGYTIFRQWENTGVPLDKVADYIREAYITALDHDYMALHLACKGHKLAQHVAQVCSNNSLPLPEKVLQMLEYADSTNAELQREAMYGLTRHEVNR